MKEFSILLDFIGGFSLFFVFLFVWFFFSFKCGLVGGKVDTLSYGQ